MWVSATDRSDFDSVYVLQMQKKKTAVAYEWYEQ
jgi:hypothetical protein